MKITLGDSTPVVMTQKTCSCVAGTALCSHIVALLYQTAHYSQLEIPVVPPVHSCTESEQQWHKPRTMGVKPGPINAMVFTKPVPKRRVQTGVRSGFYRGLVSPLPDPCMFRISEAYSRFSLEDQPLVTTMNMRSDQPLVEIGIGLVQKGSVLSYQQPAQKTRYITHIHDTPPTPHLPLDGHDDSRFREICHVKGQSSAESLADRIFKGTRQTADMKRGAEMESEVAAEYSKLVHVNYTPSGLVIHPTTPWLAASPDGVVYDPNTNPQFGLVEFKCPNVKNFVDCKYVKMENGSPKLKKSHAYYWQVQGQLLLTGMQWCDFVVWAQEDYLVQRIYIDTEVQKSIREKADYFFCYYMPRYLQMKNEL
ncbi:uncharacterized protein LOC121677449 isoform X2 [Alosa sapidissima]|uniref:uncharacterized protein LOC121677449 isoform X2 n=1 Tax=Alosa sapidissima TaxID=34773 RepID=UPI001C08E678|nr:uncharacterized protein LOC121677449 isoform X2 [Alosa sapidissima]